MSRWRSALIMYGVLFAAALATYTLREVRGLQHEIFDIHMTLSCIEGGQTVVDRPKEEMNRVCQMDGKDWIHWSNRK